MCDHFSSASLYGAVAIFAKAFILKTSIVGIKSPIKARGIRRMWLQHNRADEGCRAISVRAQYLRSVGEVGRQRRLHVVYLMKLWICSRENGGMGRRREWNLSIRAAEDGRLLG